MIPLAIYGVTNTYQWLQLREQLFNLRDFHRQKIQQDIIPYEYICKSWSGWATSWKKLIGDGRNQEDYLFLLRLTRYIKKSKSFHFK